MNCDIALYGVGVMGTSLAKNMINHGYHVAVYSKNAEELKQFQVPGKEDSYVCCKSEQDMIDQLAKPRKIFLMITAGKPVDQVTEQLLPLLEKGDLLMDGGNSYYRDTERRCKMCQDKGIYFLGVGVSGGEKGALTGPSIMPGGSREGWDIASKILQDIAAKKEGKPCCTYIASGGAGHFVKMVHNGIEYGILEIFAECYHLLRYGMKIPQEQIVELLKSWKGTQIDSYLLDASILVAGKKENDVYLVDLIQDIAGQKGTGKWTLQESVERGVYMPTIYEAVMARVFSGKKEERSRWAEKMPLPRNYLENLEREEVKEALYYGIVLCFSQGMELIHQASEEEGWQIDLPELARIWEDGCIIRSNVLKDIEAAYQKEYQPLLFTEEFKNMASCEKAVKSIIKESADTGYTFPGLISCLNYAKYYRSERMPVYFLQGLRDCFGAHTYERIDKPGSYHTEWDS